MRPAQTRSVKSISSTVTTFVRLWRMRAGLTTIPANVSRRTVLKACMFDVDEELGLRHQCEWMAKEPADAKTLPVSRVLVVFGGRSHEHQISCLSAATVVHALSEAGHAVVTSGITRDGRWTDSEVPVAAKGMLPEVAGGNTAALVAFRDGVTLVTFDEHDTAIVRRQPVDVVFPVLHGAGGEDGTIQGLCETLGVPYVGADVAASALGVDKVAMKLQFALAGLPQVPFVAVTAAQFANELDPICDTIVRQLDGPWFVKPACEGSSFGITRVTDSEELVPALANAFQFGTKVIVEAGQDHAREIEVGVIGSFDDIHVTTPGEIVSAHTFYDFDAKYVTASTLVIPAYIDEAIATEIRALAESAYRAIGCRGLARVDFFLVGTELLVNEINTIPGFTSQSMFPLLWEHEGWPFSQLVDRLIADALTVGSKNV